MNLLVPSRGFRISMLLKGIQVSQIKTFSELAPLLSLSEAQLKLIIDSKENLIKRGLIHKRDLSFRRVVWTKDDSYRHLLKRITGYLNILYLSICPDTVHGFVKGRSIVTNAQLHTKKKVVLNIDIKDFFLSIPQSKITKVFLSLGFTKEISEIFSEILTVDSFLTPGFSTSPVLSNIVCVEMDSAFEILASKNSATYTRYADDITFSSDENLPSLKDINSILHEYGFTINPNKVRIYRKGGPQYVTGLTVVDTNPRLSKRFKRSIRLELYYLKKYGLIGHISYKPKSLPETEIILSRFSRIVFGGYGIRGFIAFINSVEPNFAKKMCFILPPKEDL